MGVLMKTVTPIIKPPTDEVDGTDHGYETLGPGIQVEFFDP